MQEGIGRIAQATAGGEPRRGEARLVLAAALLLSLVLGTVHAFSLFIEPLETRFGASRSAVSLTYALALAALTGGVLIGHRVYRAVPPARLTLAIGAVAAAGMGLAAAAPSLPLVWLGYSLLFGGANGLGYGYALHVAAQAGCLRGGLAMGLATGVYGLGAAVTPALLGGTVERAGAPAALTALAAVLLLAGGAAALALRVARFRFRQAGPAAAGEAPVGWRPLLLLWVGYGAAVAAGLMALGHATGIARAAGLEGAAVLAAPSAIAAASILGGLLGGLLVDRLPVAPVLGGLPLLTALSLLLAAVAPGGEALLAAVALTGLAYGATIAAYPAAIASLFGSVAAVRIYGRVFTAWGTAGLLAPWIAGRLFDSRGDYLLALLLAACLGLLSALATWRFRALLSRPGRFPTR